MKARGEARFHTLFVSKEEAAKAGYLSSLKDRNRKTGRNDLQRAALPRVEG
jgi:hypothetical protein